MISKFLIKFFIFGAGFSLSWMVFWSWARSSCEVCVHWVMGTVFPNILILIIWPSSIFLIADREVYVFFYKKSGPA
jgi:hypothetical protein